MVPTVANKDEKNRVLLFLQDNLPEDKQLVEDVIEFLNFKANSFAGNAYSDEDPRFAGLSEGIRAKIRSECSPGFPLAVRF